MGLDDLNEVLLDQAHVFSLLPHNPLEFLLVCSRLISQRIDLVFKLLLVNRQFVNLESYSLIDLPDDCADVRDHLRIIFLSLMKLTPRIKQVLSEFAHCQSDLLLDLSNSLLCFLLVALMFLLQICSLSFKELNGTICFRYLGLQFMNSRFVRSVLS